MRQPCRPRRRADPHRSGRETTRQAGPKTGQRSCADAAFLARGKREPGGQALRQAARGPRRLIHAMWTRSQAAANRSSSCANWVVSSSPQPAGAAPQNACRTCSCPAGASRPGDRQHAGAAVELVGLAHEQSQPN
jgi:hypothetical protein